MHCSIASVRLNNVSGPFLPLMSNFAPLSYQRLLQTIGVLEAQRTQAVLDLETLGCHQREALSDPINFVEQLQKRVKQKKVFDRLTCSKPNSARQKNVFYGSFNPFIE